MIREVLPCPFCGGPGRYQDTGLDAIIYCMDCTACVYGRNKNDALDRWNHRAETLAQKPFLNGH